MQANDLTAEGMEEGVSKSRVLLIVLTKGFMSRPFCNHEVRWAKQYRCNIIGVVEDDPRHGRPDFAAEKLAAPQDLSHILEEVEFVPFRRRKHEEHAMLQEMAARIGDRPTRKHALQDGTTTVYQTQREFMVGM